MLCNMEGEKMFREIKYFHIEHWKETLPLTLDAPFNYLIKLKNE